MRNLQISGGRVERAQRSGQTIPYRWERLSVKVNGVVIPGDVVERQLAQHSLNLVVSNDDEAFKISLPGSATAVRYRGRELLLVSQHQLRGFDHSQVGMITDTGSHVITSSGMRGYQSNPDTDANDIAAFDFTEPCAAWPEFRPRFFNLAPASLDLQRAKLIGVLLMGYPAEVQSYTVHEDNKLGLARLHVPCLLDPDQPSDRALLRVRPTKPLTIHPDGMSGGTAFAFVSVNGQVSVHYAGLILRGGREGFYLLRADVVLAFLDSVLPW